ncbi:hypothetical protein MK632_21180 [Rhizobium changzhiense]|uniref:hypothetical protein n=1 Tax=Rhizobium changzhiense TaxID=2692317 RepID=UPI001F0CDC09|nr:hypothetical protein [Rhizobium changzhiense]MCH4548255.1 hypothetical protein [Rhizobium changzhiense]
MKKATGQRGSWFAKVDDGKFPCVHKYWLKKLEYHDPYIRESDGFPATKLNEFIDAIRTGQRVILTDDTPHMGPDGYPTGFTRKAYVAVYQVEQVQFDETDGLRFRLSKRLDDLE